MLDNDNLFINKN